MNEKLGDEYGPLDVLLMLQYHLASIAQLVVHLPRKLHRSLVQIEVEENEFFIIANCKLCEKAQSQFHILYGDAACIEMMNGPNIRQSKLSTMCTLGQ